jgi:hypothetical protein
MASGNDGFFSDLSALIGKAFAKLAPGQKAEFQHTETSPTVKWKGQLSSLEVGSGTVTTTAVSRVKSTSQPDEK